MIRDRKRGGQMQRISRDELLRTLRLPEFTKVAGHAAGSSAKPEAPRAPGSAPKKSGVTERADG